VKTPVAMLLMLAVHTILGAYIVKFNANLFCSEFFFLSDTNLSIIITVATILIKSLPLEQSN
jgi:hypothetical protein